MEDKRPDTQVVIKFKMPDVPDTITDSSSPEMHDRLMAFLKELSAYEIEFDSEPLDKPKPIRSKYKDVPGRRAFNRLS